MHLIQFTRVVGREKLGYNKLGYNERIVQPQMISLLQKSTRL